MFTIKWLVSLLLLVVLLLGPGKSIAYSVLTHQAIVDASWQHSMLPLLKLKYPASTDSALVKAHAFAYGGAIAPDMGYFPFGSTLFTDLVHYVRSGDFVNVMLQEASDLNEYAFALGYLCHYMADKHGHLLGTNLCVPMVYPKMKQKFGNVVTYADDKISHKRLEFSFDVLQLARGNYATEAYRNFIGFQVSRPLLERAFMATYGLDINTVFGSLSVAIESFRWSVKNLFPALTRAAWVMKKDDILKVRPTATSKNFRYRMKRANYYQEFGRTHRKPGVLATTLGWLIRVSPKVGPLRALKLKAPGPEAEKIFIQSFDTSLARANIAMKTLRTKPLNLSNIDFDTGLETSRGEYDMADVAYDNLLRRLKKDHFKGLSLPLKKNLLAFYSSAPGKNAHKAKVSDCEKIVAALTALKTHAIGVNKN